MTDKLLDRYAMIIAEETWHNEGEKITAKLLFEILTELRKLNGNKFVKK